MRILATGGAGYIGAHGVADLHFAGVGDCLHVTDLTQAHLAALGLARLSSGYEVINVGSGYGSTVFELLRAFELHTGLTVPFEIRPRSAGDIAGSRAQTRNAKEQLFRRSKLTLRDICRTILLWMYGLGALYRPGRQENLQSTFRCITYRCCCKSAARNALGFFAFGDWSTDPVGLSGRRPSWPIEQAADARSWRK